MQGEAVSARAQQLRTRPAGHGGTHSTAARDPSNSTLCTVTWLEADGLSKLTRGRVQERVPLASRCDHARQLLYREPKAMTSTNNDGPR
jgi:hypothetical protein